MNALSGGLIDVHTHVTPMKLPDCHDQALPWPCMTCTGPKQATLMLGDKPFRELDDRSWSVDRRREDMDRDGVAVQVLSPMPELLSYWFPVREAVRIADHMNAAIAEMVAKDPNRFRGLGMAPLQDAEAGARYLETLRSRFGLSGIQIGSNINGVLPGDETFRPVLAAAAAHDLSIFVHALHPIATKTLSASPMMTALVGFPVDVGMAASSLILSGALEKWPSLHIAFSHGGGALASMLGRLDQGWRSFPVLRDTLAQPPSVYARRFFYDSNVYDPSALAHIARHLAPANVFAGSDYPYPIMQTNPADFVRSSGLDASELADVHRNAALRFLREL